MEGHNEVRGVSNFTKDLGVNCPVSVPETAVPSLRMRRKRRKKQKNKEKRDEEEVKGRRNKNKEERGWGR